MFDPYNFSNIVGIKSLHIVLHIQMQYLRHKHSLLILQLINPMIQIVNQNSRTMRLLIPIRKGNIYNIVASLVRNLELIRRTISYRSNRVVPENNIVTSRSVMQVISNHTRSIVMQQYPLPMLLISTHPSHIHRVVIVTKILLKLSGLTHRYSILILPLRQLRINLRFRRR